MKAESKELIEAALKAAQAQKVTLESIREKSRAECGGVALWMVDLLGFCDSMEVLLQGLLSKEDISEFHIIDSDGEELFIENALDFIWTFYDGEELALNLEVS